MKYRIVRHDKLNWRLENWSDGGTPLPGKGGKTAAPGWRPMESYHATLRQAAVALLNHATGDVLLAGEAGSILEALALAEQRVQAALVEGERRVEAAADAQEAQEAA